MFFLCLLFSFFAGLPYLFLPRLRLPIGVPVEFEKQVWQTKGQKRFTGDEKADEWVCGVVLLLHFFQPGSRRPDVAGQTSGQGRVVQTIAGKAESEDLRKSRISVVSSLELLRYLKKKKATTNPKMHR